MLAPRTRIAVIAPSGIPNAESLVDGVRLLESWGFQPEILPGTAAKHRYLAGDTEVRRADLLRAFSGSYGAVWMARGGYGIARILPTMPWETLARVPFFGFSDGTALLNPLAERGRKAIHAPVVHSLTTLLSDASREALRTYLCEQRPISHYTTAWRKGRAIGVLRGGNLTVLASLCGTAWQVDGRDAIMLLEDLGEAPYKVDRLLTQCLDAGVFSGVRGVVLGTFHRCEPPPGSDYTVEDVLRERLMPLDVPILTGLPVGHTSENVPLPFGPVEIEGDCLRLLPRFIGPF